MLNGAGALETTEFMASHIDDFGTPKAYNHYAVGWAHAMCTPYQWTKQVASHWGGTRNGTIVHWPAGIAAKGEIRNQFHHVIDVAPTVLDAAGLPEPTFVNGVQQHPYEGVSMRYAFDDGDAPGRHETQYFEMFCNRGIYHNGLDRGDPAQHAVGHDRDRCPPSTTTCGSCTPTPTGPKRTTSRPSMPDKLARLAAALADRGEQVQRAAARRPPSRALQLRPRRPPTADQGHAQILFGGMRRLSENSVLNVKNKSHTVTCEIEVERRRSERRRHRPGRRVRRLVASTSSMARRSTATTSSALQQFHVSGDARCRRAITRCASSSPTTAAARQGRHRRDLPRRVEGRRRAHRRAPCRWCSPADETCDLGSDTGSPVSNEYTSATSDVHRHRQLGAARHRRLTTATTSSPPRSA